MFYSFHALMGNGLAFSFKDKKKRYSFLHLCNILLYEVYILINALNSTIQYTHEIAECKKESVKKDSEINRQSDG